MDQIDWHNLHEDYLKDKLKILKVLYDRANREHNMKRINEIIQEATDLSEVLSEKEQFMKARKIYPGSKGSFQLEFREFQKKHKDWKEVLPLLEPAIQKEIAHKKKTQSLGIFTPSWKNWKTWANQRCWEQEFEQLPKRTSW